MRYSSVNRGSLGLEKDSAVPAGSTCSYSPVGGETPENFQPFCQMSLRLSGKAGLNLS